MDLLGREVIERVGPGGHYLTQEHTRAHFKAETWFPALMNRQMRRTWEAAGSTTLADRARARVLDILQRHQPMPLADGIEARLRQMVAAAETRHQPGD